ncbi:nuclear transport factor 2 family protein [Dactylosporangium sp. NPDC051484]|uniref:nuclear transport factor 2 family protein n=1 Tax=Dactylosporangium sp. NPDC051484 TaxID=3154942 RepID=UPI00344B88E6
MTDLEAVTRWVEGYVRAWHTNDPDDIGELFAEDAAYYPAPYREPWRGRDTIVRQWLGRVDASGEAAFTWFPITVGPDLSILQGTTTYPSVVYSNLWLIRLDTVGQCREFTEWWMRQTGDSG